MNIHNVQKLLKNILFLLTQYKTHFQFELYFGEAVFKNFITPNIVKASKPIKFWPI